MYLITKPDADKPVVNSSYVYQLIKMWPCIYAITDLATLYVVNDVNDRDKFVVGWFAAIFFINEVLCLHSSNHDML